ncbi:putative phospholipase [Hyphodiscus hymeniophilus]|uniref:Phospholipase n=1 Tax=Hyphodiscus hymeniophilus TaxID=353542 RepID=A0A9P6VPJ0_9HELO|nr:putative phospholipase [Hyphodiscus hymeniophilus]
MSQPTHTYGPTCHLTKPVTSASKGDDDIPEMHPQFFYSALYHIDDPLSAAPTSSASDSKSLKYPPRPFSAFDNHCLEAAWLKLGSEKDRKNHNNGKSHKASRPSRGGKLGSVVETLTSKVEQKKRSAEQGASFDSKRPNPLASKQSSSRAAKKLSRFSADATSEHLHSQATCSCDGGHDTCECKPGQCDCGSCPKASVAAKSSPESVVPSSTAKSGKSKETSNTFVTSDSKPGAPTGATLQSLPVPHTHPKNDAKGEAYNSVCDDPHACLEVKCCSDYEGKKSQLSNVEPTFHQEKAAKSADADCDLGECQGDAPNELVDKASRSSREPKSAQSPTTEPNSELSSKEHTEFEKHGHSKEHQSFTEHLQAKHLNVKKPAPTTIRKQKVSETDASYESADRPDQTNDAGTTGRPFLKLPSRPTTPRLASSDMAPPKDETPAFSAYPPAELSKRDHSRDDRDSTETEAVLDHKCKAHKSNKHPVDVPVGASRLHKVCLPALQMEPIYWSPVNDVASVTRGTWFYKETMLPVEPPVANQLEMGYRAMRPWSQTWKDELRSAMDVGAAGEEKVAHRLWPKDADKSITSEDILSTDPYCAAKCFQGEAAAEGSVDPDGLDRALPNAKTIVKKYPNCQVIYKDSRDAFILKPSLQPSAYHKRRPIYKISKGLTVGIHVCRGFNQQAWEKMHPSKKKDIVNKVEGHVAVSGDSGSGRTDTCPGCRLQGKPRECTDLCLVIHGIGQKLSERMESFHFTHAINAFRRSVNAELANDGVQKVCRDDLGGVMVLPVNWRSNLSFEDDPLKDGENHQNGSNFSLKDITQPTIPAIRSMISDVMLDVPYYMSNNKDKMVHAVISEANRVYRLWCKNNPDFCKNGRVHVIAHSLGSVMAMEILSKQPTLIPKVDPNAKKLSRHLEFNTTNLFCAGSPAGFFLLLEKRRLVPRKGQNKPGADVGDDKDKSIVGEQGTFGCLAVDNIYNVMHTNDPIAYRLNACADAAYATSLKEARVPSATIGFFESIGNAMKVLTPGSTAPPDLAIGQIPNPTLTARMPSQLEMEVHDFTAEEKAESKFYLLNDNGQMDYCLSSGGGPLEIQYINMLGAHSSYWASPDFIRMFCTEIGRKPGKATCLPNMKAVKIRHKT